MMGRLCRSLAVWVALVSGAALVFGSALSGCIFAPAAVSGVGEGSPCGTDLDCDNGLACECGTCATLTDTPQPPSCEVTPDNRCPDVASECFLACGDETVVGLAECVEGRETCESSAGVLRDFCGLDTCWGEPAPGESCFGGVWDCMFGRNEETGLCYTFDCVGTPEECVESCLDDERTTQICLADTYTCEFGFPVAQCGGCVGTPPDCFDNCDDLNTIAAATCLDNDWSCNHIMNAELQSDCCEDDVNVLTEQAYLDHQGLKCTTGTLLVRYQTLGTLSLPSLKRAGDLLFYENESTAIELPALERVDGAFSLWMNQSLVEASFPELDFVGGSFEIAFNDSLPQCRAEALTAGVENIVGLQFVHDNDDAALCGDGGVLDGGPVADAGLDDGGPGPDGPDAGDPDAGMFDGGAPVDAGAVDAGSVDSGVDSGPSDGG